MQKITLEDPPEGFSPVAELRPAVVGDLVLTENGVETVTRGEFGELSIVLRPNNDLPRQGEVWVWTYGNEPYIVARVTIDSYVFVSLADGNRFADPGPLEKIFNNYKHSMSRAAGTAKQYFASVAKR